MSDDGSDCDSADDESDCLSDGDGNVHVNENGHVSENVNERKGGDVDDGDVEVECGDRRCLVDRGRTIVNFERLG